MGVRGAMGMTMDLHANRTLPCFPLWQSTEPESARMWICRDAWTGKRCLVTYAEAGAVISGHPDCEIFKAGGPASAGRLFFAPVDSFVWRE